MSTKTGKADRANTAFTVAINVYGGTITSSPACTSNPCSAVNKADVPLATARQCGTPISAANFASNASTAFPDPRYHFPDRSTFIQAASSFAAHTGHPGNAPVRTGAPPNNAGFETAAVTAAPAAAATAVRRVICTHRTLYGVRLQDLQRQIIACNRCPRLREHCQTVARVKRRAYRDEDYWGRPVPSFGDPNARLVIIGLAPAAHGANRTGRIFTGDRSGDFLFQALCNTGFANQPTSSRKDDGLKLTDAWITCPVHCAPPGNKPLPEEIANCRPYLEQELKLLKNAQVIVVLGRIAFDTYLTLKAERKAAYKFAHGAAFLTNPTLICSYHPSQQNTQTGRLTQPMLTQVFQQAREAIR